MAKSSRFDWMNHTGDSLPNPEKLLDAADCLREYGMPETFASQLRELAWVLQRLRREYEKIEPALAEFEYHYENGVAAGDPDRVWKDVVEKLRQTED